MTAKSTIQSALNRTGEVMNYEKLLEIVWSWPTVAVAGGVVFRSELKKLLARIADSRRTKFGPIEFEGSVEVKSESGAVPTERIEGKRFGAEKVNLDGKQFERCVFDRSTLVYSGTAPTSLRNCEFRAPQWGFEGPAGATLNFISGLHSGLNDNGEVAARIFNFIRSSSVASTTDDGGVRG